ncbi:MAG: hypothetical protein DBX47_06780 [Clostridiales bacterium]|nr:MAG: hypothetical protein DBX47_06780 [Clostridiales bacterium]
MYASLTNTSKTHIANEVAGLPPHTFHKVDFVSIYLFLTCYIKTASVYRLASTDAETTPNPAHIMGKTAVRFTLLCKVGFGGVAIVFRIVYTTKE